MALLKASEIKKLVKVAKCIAEHNGGKKTVDADVVHLHFGA